MRGQNGILYDGFETGPNFERARTQISTPFAYLDVALDVAGVDQYFDICGDFLYFDALYDGVVSIELNNQQAASKAPFKASQGFALSAIFTRIKLNWSAQIGKKVRIMYSTGDRVVPSNSAVTTLSGTSTVTDGGQAYAAKFSSTAAIASLGTENVVAAASNVAGLVLHRAHFQSANAGATVLHGFMLHAHTAAPAAITDGDGLMQADSWVIITAALGNQSGKIEKPLRIATGKGIWFRNGTGAAESSAVRSVLYSLG